ncbi:DnaA N-terminal domain-containing protein [Paenibacillus vini]|uniref:DnaA N-terminal domain-containing protein n=1 Tax=Paenibacillus vini TaxID=1476024 RepID=UPI0025B65FC8|nr:DnaA N-terminal domain-containing protein [Paenibacillus vini]MDN4067697.1 DnaA N-terminal domain-containing protein [Paenibacillus vini]
MLDKNLKGNHHKLLYYRYRPTGVEEAKVRKVRDTEQAYRKKELEKIYIPEDEVKRFSLDKHGQPIPYVDGHMTVISNYIYDYWGHFFSAEGVALYGHLKRYCYGDKDYCWPDLNLISQKMNKSRNTIKKILLTLERHGFVLVFNVQNADKNNMEESPLFKVRKKVPFLPMDLYEQLPTELKLDHDRYMQGIVEQFDQILRLDPSIDYSEVYEEVINKGTVVRKIKTPLELDKELSNKIKVLENEISDRDRQVWDMALTSMQSKLSKPSYDTWLKNTFCIKRGSNYTVYSPSNFVSEWLQSRYDKMIREAISAIDSDFDQVDYDFLNYNSFNQRGE